MTDKSPRDFLKRSILTDAAWPITRLIFLCAVKRFNEWSVGGNWYVQGNDLKFQVGVVHGETSASPAGSVATATATGMRSQMQIQF